MTTIETIITDFTTNASKAGYVARFKLRIGDILTIEDVGLLRPTDDLDFVHVIPPKSGSNIMLTLAPGFKNQVNRQAAAMYTAATGIKVAGSTQRSDEKPRVRHVPEREPPIEDDDAGMRRVIGETMEAAGL